MKEKERRLYTLYVFIYVYTFYNSIVLIALDVLEHFTSANCAVLCYNLSDIRTGMTTAQNCLYSATMLLRWHCV